MRIWPVLALALGLGACAGGADEASQQRPDGHEPVASSTTTAPGAAPSLADGPFDGTCPISQAEVAAAIGEPMAQGDPTPQECRFEHDVDVDDGVLSISFVVTWTPRDDAGATVEETGSSTSQTNDSGHHRTSERFETEHWEGTVAVDYEWARRATPDHEAGQALVEELVDRIEGSQPA